jgi:hypothetical protein
MAHSLPLDGQRVAWITKTQAHSLLTAEKKRLACIQGLYAWDQVW